MLSLLPFDAIVTSSICSLFSLLKVHMNYQLSHPGSLQDGILVTEQLIPIDINVFASFLLFL